MKQVSLLWICLGCFSFIAFSQNLNVYDLYLIKVNTDINQINYFLVNYKDFEYISSSIDEDGMKNYKFSKEGNELVASIISGSKNGQFYEITGVQYIIYDINEYHRFINSLITFKFKKGEQNYLDDGTPIVMWSGTRDLKDMIRVVTIIEDGNTHFINAD